MCILERQGKNKPKMKVKSFVEEMRITQVPSNKKFCKSTTPAPGSQGNIGWLQGVTSPKKL